MTGVLPVQWLMTVRSPAAWRSQSSPAAMAMNVLPPKRWHLKRETCFVVTVVVAVVEPDVVADVDGDVLAVVDSLSVAVVE